MMITINDNSKGCCLTHQYQDIHAGYRTDYYQKTRPYSRKNSICRIWSIQLSGVGINSNLCFLHLVLYGVGYYTINAYADCARAVWETLLHTSVAQLPKLLQVNWRRRF